MVKSLSSNVNIIMAQYIVEPMKTLKKWVKPFVKMNNLDNFEYIYYTNFRNIDKYELSKSNTIMSKTILNKHPNKIDWRGLSYNPSKWAYKLLNKINRECLSKINFYLISKNPSRWAYKLLQLKPDRIYYDILSKIQ